MRPPAPGARFFISTWVPVDELTPEEQAKYAPEKETTTAPTANEAGDAEMTAADVKPNPEQEGRETAETVTAVAAESQDTVMVAVDSTAEETKEKSVPVSATATISTKAATIGDSEMTTDKPVAEKTEVNPLDQLVNTAMDTKPAAGGEPDGAEAKMASVDTDEQKKAAEPDTVKESAAASRPAALSPLEISRETSASEGIPASEAAKALESAEDLEGELRPHDPVADTLADTATAPPSRPVSEPAAILMKGPAAPLVGDSVMLPVPVAAKDSPPTGPVAAPDDPRTGSFVHSGSDSTPFHALKSVASKDEKDATEAEGVTAEPSSTAKSNADSGDRVSEPEKKRPRIE